MSGPITPDEAREKKQEFIPEFVFEAFNELITKYLNRTHATFTQDEVVKLILSKMHLSTVTFKEVEQDREKIFTEHWLDVESLYRNVGWDVEYDSPGYNETYTATFTFRKRS